MRLNQTFLNLPWDFNLIRDVEYGICFRNNSKPDGADLISAQLDLLANFVSTIFFLNPLKSECR